MPSHFVRNTVAVGVLSVMPAIAGLLATSLATAQERPPATPLIVHNPYFSIWSDTNTLTGSNTRHWTGHPQQLTGLVRIDGKSFRIMGESPAKLPALKQTAMQLTLTHTRYSFAGAGVAIELTFFTPAFLNDLDILSRPVTYLTWAAHATDGAQHDLSVLLDASPDIATSYEGQPVAYSRYRTAGTQVLSVGSREQAVLNRSGDDLRISSLPSLTMRQRRPRSRIRQWSTTSAAGRLRRRTRWTE
jgi:hypothetical protein